MDQFDHRQLQKALLKLNEGVGDKTVLDVILAVDRQFDFEFNSAKMAWKNDKSQSADIIHEMLDNLITLAEEMKKSIGDSMDLNKIYKEISSIM